MPVILLGLLLFILLFRKIFEYREWKRYDKEIKSFIFECSNSTIDKIEYMYKTLYKKSISSENRLQTEREEISEKLNIIRLELNKRQIGEISKSWENEIYDDDRRLQAFLGIDLNSVKNTPSENSTNNTSRENKPASVVGRSIVGGVVAGPAGAVVGALSAVDKNIRNSNKSNDK